MNNLDCVMNAIEAHRIGGQWTNEAVARDILGQLGLDTNAEAKNAAPPLPDPNIVTEDEVAQAELAAKQAQDKADEARAKLAAQQAEAAADDEAAKKAAEKAEATRAARTGSQRPSNPTLDAVAPQSAVGQPADADTDEASTDKRKKSS